MEGQFHSKPEVSQAFDEAVPLLLLGAGIEVVGAEVLVRGSVLQRVIDGREARSRNGENGFLEAAPGFDAVVLGVDVAAQAPCTGVVLSQGDPLRTRVEFSRALVAAGRRAGPGNELGKAAHVGAHLGEDLQRSKALDALHPNSCSMAVRKGP